MVEVTLEPLGWAIIWLIVVILLVLRNGDKINKKRRATTTNEEPALNDDVEDELDHFMVTELIDEDEEE